MPPQTFDHEKLHVYQRSIQFSSFIPLNIAEGTGKTTPSDRCCFFDIARGSAVECAACLDVLPARKFVAVEEILPGKEMLLEIVRMLVGLIRTNEPHRIREDSVGYLGGEE